MNFAGIQINEDTDRDWRSEHWFEKMKNGWRAHLPVLISTFYLSSAHLLPHAANRSWKVNWFRGEKKEKKDQPRRHNKRTKHTNSLTGGSCETAAGSTGVFFDDNAGSLCSLSYWALCFHFSSAQLSAGNRARVQAHALSHQPTLRVITNCDETYYMTVQ